MKHAVLACRATPRGDELQLARAHVLAQIAGADAELGRSLGGCEEIGHPALLTDAIRSAVRYGRRTKIAAGERQDTRPARSRRSSARKIEANRFSSRQTLERLAVARSWRRAINRS